MTAPLFSRNGSLKCAMRGVTTPTDPPPGALLSAISIK